MLVLVLGMVIGSDGLELINFGDSAEDYDAAQSAAIMALALILYEGGLSSGWAEIRPVIGQSIALATAGTILTAGLTAIVALWLIDELTGLEALMLGSTVAATDAAAVFAVLRGSTLRRRLARTLEGESGVNDPIAILLVIGCIEAVQHPDFGILTRVWLAVSELAIGAAVGLAVGALGVIVLRRVTLPSAGLYPVASVAFAGIAYGGARHDPRLRLPRRVPRRAGDRQCLLARPAHGDHVPRGTRVGRAARALPAARPARQPGRADRVHPRGHRDRRHHGRDRAAARGAARRLRLHVARSG